MSNVVQLRSKKELSALEVLDEIYNDTPEYVAAIWKGKDGKLWFKSSDGMSRLETMGACAAIMQDIWNT